jgi:predicted acetyltransferase
LSEAEKRERFEKRLREGAGESDGALIAGYRDGVLVGAMDWYDYTMRLRGTDVFAGGLGSVAVSLDARRRGVAGDLVRAFIDAYRARGATVVLLHPFRHDFYRRFGFGHGTKMNRYHVPPLELPEGPGGERVRKVDATAAQAIAACYERVRLRTNGLIVTSADDFRKQLGDATLRCFAYLDEHGEIRGFLLARPIPRPRDQNDSELRVHEPIVENPAAMRALLAFLRALSDQFARIVLETQDDAFHIVPRDPRDESGRILHPPAYHETNQQGAGVMYRVLDVPRALEALAENAAEREPNVWASLRVHDALIPANSEAFDLALREDGSPKGVTLMLDIADFSSLVVGSVRLRSLHHYGLATISDPDAVGPLDRLFAAQSPPLCTTHF